MKKLVKSLSAGAAGVMTAVCTSVSVFAESGIADSNAQTGVVSNFVPLIVTAIAAVGVAGVTAVIKMKADSKLKGAKKEKKDQTKNEK
ncbi:MAG: hypothetical protein ACI4J1_01445 [Ruminiclostridium sp.]